MELFHAMIAGILPSARPKSAWASGLTPHLLDPNIGGGGQDLRTKLHAKVTIKRNAKGAGEIRVHFGSDEELGALLERL